jgi:hypothetical protein
MANHHSQSHAALVIAATSIRQRSSPRRIMTSMEPLLRLARIQALDSKVRSNSAERSQETGSLNLSRKNSPLFPPVFASSRTLRITILLSSALVMS